MKRFVLGGGAALALLVLGASQASAQTITFADAYDRLDKACAVDIERHCGNVPLGGGKIKACLDANKAKLSAACSATTQDVYAQLAKRSAAQASVVKVCDRDIRQYCSKVQPGDGYRIQCLVRSTKVVSKACQQTILDAGWNT
jgi:hypothetical protein